MTSDIKDNIIVGNFHFGDLLGGGKFGLDRRICEEFDTFVVPFKGLKIR